MRFTCLTLREILCGLNIKDPDCARKVCTIQRVLRDFYTQISNTKLSRIAVAFSGAGNKTIQFPHGVKQVHDFIVTGNCINNKCFHKIENCSTCPCDNAYQMVMQEVWKTPLVGQYYFTKEEGNTVLKMNVHAGVTEGWVIYSRGPEEINSIDDEICIDDNALILLQYMIMEAYAEKNREINMAQYWKNKFNEGLRKENEIQERLPYRIWGLHQPTK